MANGGSLILTSVILYFPVDGWKLFFGSSLMVEVGEPVREKAVGIAPDEIFVFYVDLAWCR